MAAYTTIAAVDLALEAATNAGGPTAGYLTPGQIQNISITSSGTGNGVRITLVTTPSPTTVWVDSNIAYVENVSGGSEANGTWAAINVSGATFEIVPRKETTWVAGGTQRITRTSDSAVGTVIGVNAVSGGIQLVISGTATTWAVGDEVTGTGILGVTNANGVYVVRAATNVTNSTVDLAVKFVSAGSGGTVVRGDTVTINHAITVSTPTAIGISSGTASNNAIQVNNNGTTNTGKITIVDGGILIARGRVNITGSAGASGSLEIQAGGIYEFDSHYAPVPTRYQLKLNGTTDKFEFTGSSASSRAIVRANTSPQILVSGTPTPLGGQFTSGFSGNPRIITSWAHISGAGGPTTTYAIYGNLYPDITNTIFDSCGTIYIAGIPADSTVRFQTSTWKNSLASPVIVTAVNNAKGSGTWIAQGCVFDKGIGIAANTDFIINGNIIAGHTGSAGVVQTTGLGMMTNCLMIVRYATSGAGYYQAYDNCVFWGVYQSRNARMSNANATYGDPSPSIPTFNNLIIDFPNISAVAYTSGAEVLPASDGDTGDLIQTPGSNPVSPITVTIANSIALPVSSGHPAESYASRGLYPGTMFTGRGFANMRMRAYNCTWPAYDGSPTRGSHGVINVAESTPSSSGTVPEFFNILAWSDVTSGMPLTLDTSVNYDAITVAGVHHNGTRNLISQSQPGGSNGTRYYGLTTGTPGVGDINNVDPEFVDKTRCMVNWIRSLRGDLGTLVDGLPVWSGGTNVGATYDDENTIAFGLAEMLKLNDTDYNPAYNLAAYQAYIREGFAPTAIAYRNTDSTGIGTIGAIPWVANGQFIRDSFSGLGAGVSISGRTASDGVSVWTAHNGNFLGTGDGFVYPATSKFIGQLISIDNSVASQTNQDISWTWRPAATPQLSGSWQTAVAVKIRNAQFTQCLYAILEATSGSGGQIKLVESDAQGGFSRESTSSSIFASLLSDISCVLSIRAGTATLTCTGGFTFSTTLVLSITASAFGGIGLMAYNPSSGGITSTTGVHTGNITASNYLTEATSYAIVPGFEIYATTPIQYSSKYPSAFYLNNANVGNKDAGYAGNRLLTLALNGVAPSGGFTFTPTGWTLNDSVGVPQTTIVIPEDADNYEFALKPPIGTIDNYTVSGTNNRSFSNPSISLNCRPNLCLWEGDSYSDRAFGALWPSSVRTAIGTTWNFQTSAAAFSKLDDGTASPSLNIKLRQAITVEPFHDQLRTKEAYGLWGGTNDLFGTDSGAAAFVKLQTCVNNAKAALIQNIAVGTITARQADVGVGGPGQSVFETRRQDFNTLVKAAYGSSGSDTTVDVLDFGGDAILGASDIWSNASYFPDGTHPTGAAAVTIIQGYITAWLASVPDNGAPAGGVFRTISFDAGFSDMTGGYRS